MGNDNRSEEESEQTGNELPEKLAPLTPGKLSTDEEPVVPNEVLEAIKELPPEQKQIVSSLFLSMERSSAPGSSTLAKRVTSEHITQTLNNLEKESERDFKRSESNEVTKRLGMGAILILVLMVLGYAGLTKDKELADKVIIAGISGLGGFGAGVAVSKKEP